MNTSINIPSVKREGENIYVTFHTLDIPPKNLNLAKPKLVHLHNVARDSAERPPSAPIIRINTSSFPMIRDSEQGDRWMLRMPSPTTVSLLYGDLEYECGEI